jgi:acyl carrier protein
MPEDAVYEAIKQVLVDELKLDASAIRPEADLRRDLGLDSLDVATVAMALEEKLGVEVSDEAMQDVQTVQDAVTFLSRHVPAGETS